MSLLDKAENGKAYWRSLDELAGTPEFKAFLEREFPQGAPDFNNPITRRTFLSLMGASMALAGLTSCRKPVEKIVPYVKAPEEIIPGVPKYYATAMPTGTGSMGFVVESHEGRPTKIEGNKLHPQSLGAASAQHQAEILNLYDPDRARWVSEKGVQKSWADFVTFWREQHATFSANQGRGLAVISPQFSSPTIARLQREFKRTFPEARWVVYEPVSDENIFEGIRLATGSAYQPVYAFDQAAVILALDADFLLKESDSVRNARRFADGRRVSSERDTMNRLYAVESTYTITGAMADHRLALQGQQIGAFAGALAVALQKRGLSFPGSEGLGKYREHPFDMNWLQAVADDLMAARGRSLIVAGRHQPPAVHALVFAINEALGNTSRTVAYYPMTDKAFSSRNDLATLTQSMQEGAVQAVVVLGGNPVFDAPADLAFAAALDHVPTSIHLSLSFNETSEKCSWHLPEMHFLESWGDVRALDGTMSVTQPLIAPLFDPCHSLIEVLQLLNTGVETSGYELVRQTWQAPARLSTGEKTWRRILHDGVLANSALATIRPNFNAGTLREALASLPDPATHATADDVELAFVPSTSVFDGRHANNGWLQELPDPVTKISWDNVALISLKLAREKKLQNGDLIALENGERSLRIPAWILPGQPDYTVTIALGYGRWTVGRVGAGAGFNSYSLRTITGFDYARGFKIARTGEKYKIANLQDHGTVDGRTLIVEGTLAHYKEEPDFVEKAIEVPPRVSMWREHKYDKGYQWGMTIDLNVCTGCNACTIACQSENNIPVVGKDQAAYGREMHWIRLDRYFTGENLENPGMVFQPVACQHCEMAPCEQVCPVAATVHDEEGLNAMAYNRCIGTRYCSNNCPYKVRRFNWFNFTKDTPEIVQMAMNPDVTVRFRGVMEKCTFCVQRINEARQKAKLEHQDGKREQPLIRDGEIRTACQQTCPTGAIVFGNINDPNSRVSQIKKQNRNYEMLAELNLRTRNTFLAKLRNPNPALVSEHTSDAHA